VLVRITALKDTAAPTVRVEGGLDRDNVSQLLGEVGPAPAGVVLDLCCLRSADAAAVHTLQELMAAGAVVEGASPYVARLLEEVEPDTGEGPVDE
jgi:hypothetical protein